MEPPRFFPVIAVFALALFWSAPLFAKGEAEAEPIRAKFGVLLPSQDRPWHTALYQEAVQATALAAMESLGNFEFRILTASAPEEQLAQITGLEEWGMGWLLILPLDFSTITLKLKELHSKSVRIVVIDQSLGNAGFGYADISGDYAAMGSISGQWLAKKMKAAFMTNYLCLGGRSSLSETELMDTFFGEMSKEPSLVNVLGEGQYKSIALNAESAYKETAALLRRFPKIDALFCQDDDILTGVLKAVKESGRKDIRLLLGGGGSRETLRLIRDNDPLVKATTLYSPKIAAEAIGFAVSSARNPEGDGFHEGTEQLKVRIPTVLIDKSNVGRYFNGAF
ncbi:substrate-binding domain-containing protein [Leadbettera azotonutricia]|uniref:Putative periplasmic binding protein/LacI transcriptional regulator n=1 Tax=Leadbettera azotonutricia (strain ATCC BAA-888 / DSM 13862 / ZAS-9) TaxID=545695 RepID=F5YC00_LEAAZ|nr:substrate-binding domain-containing protein [Leadbettera azotonutricia]AEF80485.1 putative periplasmic binding protein/LacI transcriptional regulator [Leadbettera azotonutricia ZAS-9]